jgi:hypothetical protein
MFALDNDERHGNFVKDLSHSEQDVSWSAFSIFGIEWGRKNGIMQTIVCHVTISLVPKFLTSRVTLRLTFRDEF